MAAPETWEFTDHCCRICQGRVMKRKDGDLVIVRCSVCEAQAEGGVREICCCGASRKAWNAKLRCRRQEKPTPTFPAAIVAEEVPSTMSTRGRG